MHDVAASPMDRRVARPRMCKATKPPLHYARGVRHVSRAGCASRVSIVLSVGQIIDWDAKLVNSDFEAGGAREEHLAIP